MTTLPVEIVKKINEEHKLRISNSKLEHDNICELVYSNLVDCLTSNYTTSSRVINIPVLKHNRYIYLKNCFKEDTNLEKIQKKANIYYYFPRLSDIILNGENVKIDYDFTVSNLVNYTCFKK